MGEKRFSLILKTNNSPQSEENESMSELFNLISQKKWTEVKQALSNTHNSSRSLKLQAKTKYNKVLPLHRAVEYNAPFAVVEALVKIHPDGCKEGDGSGRIPLHIVCWKHKEQNYVKPTTTHRRDSYSYTHHNDDDTEQENLSENTLNTIKLLIETYREGTHCRDVHGRLPLHVACEFIAPEIFLKLLLSAFPTSIYVEDKFRRTPLKIVDGLLDIDEEKKKNLMLLLQGDRVSRAAQRRLSEVSCSELRRQSFSSDYAPPKINKSPSTRSERSVTFAPEHKLYNLICDKKWDDAIVCCFQKSKEATTWYENTVGGSSYGTSSTKSITKLRQLPIHKACELQPPRGLVKILIEVNRASLQEADHNGRLPLHSACSNSAPEEVVLLLVKTYPEATKVKDTGGRLPLHWACQSGLTESAIKALLKTYPESVNTRDDFQKTPQQITQENYFYNKQAVLELLQVPDIRSTSWDCNLRSISRCSSRASSRASSASPSRAVSRGDGTTVDTRIYTAISGDMSRSRAEKSLFVLINSKQWANVELRARLHAGEASHWRERKRSDGTLLWRLLPLHRACELQPSLNVVEELIHAYRDALFIKDHSGRLPIHSACRKLAKPSIISLLVNENPDSTKEKDKKGRLPVHVACEYGADKETISTLVRSFPEALKERDNRGYTPMDLVDSSKHYNKDDMREGLCLHNPSVPPDISPSDKSILHQNHPPRHESRYPTTIEENNTMTTAMSERSAILKNLSLSFASEYADVDHHHHHNLTAKHTHNPLPPHRHHDNAFINNSSTSGGSGHDMPSHNGSITTPKQQDNDDTYVGSASSESGTEGEDRTLLCSMVKNMQWDKAVERCQHFPEEAGKWWIKRDREGAPLWQVLPIHKACELNPTKEVIQALVDAYPTGLQAKDQNGRLPIHLACCRGANTSVVRLLAGTNGDILKLKDAQGRLPLHVACVHGASEKVINLLGSLYPESVEEVDDQQRTPLKIASASTHTNRSSIIYVLRKLKRENNPDDKSVGSRNSHSSFRRDRGIDRTNSDDRLIRPQDSYGSYTSSSLVPIQSVEIKASPSMLEIKQSISTDLTAVDSYSSESFHPPKLYTLIDKQRWDIVGEKIGTQYRSDTSVWYVKKSRYDEIELRQLPLHRACQLRAPLKNVREIFQCYPTAGKSPNHVGKLPLHCACESNSDKEVIDFLLMNNPEAVNHRDTYGMLPIHHACDNGCGKNVIMDLIKAFPACMDLEDRYRRTPRKILQARYYTSINGAAGSSQSSK